MTKWYTKYLEVFEKSMILSLTVGERSKEEVNGSAK
jgi:hypothetical protein